MKTKKTTFRLVFCGYALNNVKYPTRAKALKALDQPRYSYYRKAGAHVVQRTA